MGFNDEEEGREEPYGKNRRRDGHLSLFGVATCPATNPRDVDDAWIVQVSVLIGGDYRLWREYNFTRIKNLVSCLLYHRIAEFNLCVENTYIKLFIHNVYVY